MLLLYLIFPVESRKCESPGRSKCITAGPQRRRPDLMKDKLSLTIRPVATTIEAADRGS